MQCFLIAYDIADPRRLRQVERALAAVGERVHNSLFIAHLTPHELVELQLRLARRIDANLDTLRYTPWCHRDQAATRHFGTSHVPEIPHCWIV